MEVVQLRLPASLMREIRYRLRDPLTRRVRYGGLSEYFEQLAKADLAHERKQERDL